MIIPMICRRIMYFRTGNNNATVQFEASYRNITFDAGLGTVSPTVKEVKRNAAVGELPALKAQNKVFLGWYYGDTKYTAETVYNAESDITLTARWRN